MSREMMLREHADVMSVEAADRISAEIALARQMAEILQRMYPGHQWATFADSRQGIVWVAIPALMGPSLRFVIHISKMTTYPEMCSQLMEAAGQILERFKVPRGKFELHLFSDALKKRIKDHKTPMPE